ncbi:type II secretion system F family protein [Geomesophilobacter sediminis]|uniref:Type II secretion system F family protein n=1 Tax=Geomesophilobacter sediminis TaxID=2798584 RepID=A0A8J7J871_9BACT|nr:type II secretion system F family protein [Geomesophilobacter sediminis]MBJ6725726.1 type II secretion system F family protein [Geomesophilobacter sediminis]
MLTLICCATFLSIAVLAGTGAYRYLGRHATLNRRVAGLMPEEKETPALVATQNIWQLYLAEMGERLRVKPSDLRSYRGMMMAAGFRPQAVYIFLGMKLLLAMVLPGIYLLLFVLPQGRPLGSDAVTIATGCAIGGFLLPTFWIGRRGKARKEEIFHTLPDVLDLLTVCVEAGLGLDAALLRTADSFYQAKNPLCKEIILTILEIRAGKPRPEALKGLAERTMVDDVRSLVTMLIQTEKFGTSLGKTLRTFSDSLRLRRKQFAEERASKTAVKMLFPLTFCIFPALLIVMLTPAVFQIAKIFKP